MRKKFTIEYIPNEQGFDRFTIETDNGRYDIPSPPVQTTNDSMAVVKKAAEFLADCLSDQVDVYPVSCRCGVRARQGCGGYVMVLTDERSREAFEKVVFDRHFFSTIKRTGLGMCMEFMPDPAKRLTKAELLERNGDDYKREDVSAMWFGWKEAVKLMNPIIIAAGEVKG